MYVIQKGDKYFSSGGSKWVNQSGHCDTPTWVENAAMQGWGTTSLVEAQAVADLHGGKPVKLY